MRQLTRRQRMSAIVLAIVALCFITLDLGGGGLSEAHNGVRGTLGSLYRGTDTVLGPVRRWMAGVPSAGTNESKIEQLRHENAVLAGRLNAAQSDRDTDAQLSRLQRAADGDDHRILPARVVAFGPGEGFDWTVTIDAGSTDGVQVGQTVTDGVGLVGRVLHADSSSAVVLLAADPGSGVGVRDVRTGEIGLVSGDGASGLTLDPIDPNAVIKVGDRLITGPTRASSYVAGLSVGTVRSVRTAADGTLRAQVEPTSSPTSVDLVGVILGATSDLAGRSALSPTGTTGR
jgi:rod shape-determining protein MreC